MKRGNLDSVDVHFESRSNTSSDEERQQMASQLAHNVKSLIVFSCKVCVNDENTINRSLGKAKRVIDEMKNSDK